MVSNGLWLRPLSYSGSKDSDRRSDADSVADAISIEPAVDGDALSFSHSVAGADATDSDADTAAVANAAAFVSNLEVADHCASAHVPGLEVAVDSAVATHSGSDRNASASRLCAGSVWSIL